ncbi:hypothetical protein RIF29_18880 [Crotalaria pallida]|uniref:Uncharacterized protein n=1 Tax=Crotalaria pallida TaxID=3830 RepID=A0AAN9F6S2_CROPI
MELVNNNYLLELEGTDGIRVSDALQKGVGGGQVADIMISLEKEIRKLKLELKRTTEQYNMACREAVLARQRAMELEKNGQEKERGLEKARLAEEVALTLVEVERQKTKAATCDKISYKRYDIKEIVCNYYDIYSRK